MLRAWLKDELKTAPLPLVVHRGQLVNRFLDWLAAREAIAANPIAELRRKYECRSSAAVLRALAGSAANQGAGVASSAATIRQSSGTDHARACESHADYAGFVTGTKTAFSSSIGSCSSGRAPTRSL